MTAVSEEKKEVVTEEVPVPVDVFRTTMDSLHMLGKGVNGNNSQLSNRAVTRLFQLRGTKQGGFKLSLLRKLAKMYHPEVESHMSNAVDKDSEMDVTEDEEVETLSNVLPEVKAMINLMVVVYLIDHNMNEDALKSVNGLVEFIQQFNRRSLDVISARTFYYYSLVHEKLNKLSSIRNNLMVFHRRACLQHNEPAQASLTNAILRNFLIEHMYSHADQFRLNSTFPESSSSADLARYLYYVGRIQSVQLNYNEAFENLTQALRKAPQKSAIGFRQVVQKTAIIVQLLTGEIPERSVFVQSDMKTALSPYYELTQAVRIGNLEEFNRVSMEFKKNFEKDEVFNLITRLRHNVIKVGLRKITMSYGRISMTDVCIKLKLDTVEDAEYIVSKAIYDGVIDAILDRENHILTSKMSTNLYASAEPRVEFDKRIGFCMRIHNEAVKAMCFPPNAHKTQAELDAEDEQRTKEEEEYEGDMDPEDVL